MPSTFLLSLFAAYTLRCLRQSYPSVIFHFYPISFFITGTTTPSLHFSGQPSPFHTFIAYLPQPFPHLFTPILLDLIYNPPPTDFPSFNFLTTYLTLSISSPLISLSSSSTPLVLPSSLLTLYSTSLNFLKYLSHSSISIP